jgi:hypothetical protein
MFCKEGESPIVEQVGTGDRCLGAIELGHIDTHYLCSCDALSS